jgi:hypothetical protein
MKKIILLLLLFSVSLPAFCEEYRVVQKRGAAHVTANGGNGNFIGNWTNSIATAGFPVLPGLSFHRNRQYVAFGLMVSAEETDKEDDSDIVNQLYTYLDLPLTMLTATIFWRYDKNDIVLYFNYNNDRSFGFSVQINY